MVSKKVHLSRLKRDCASTSLLRALHGRGTLRVPDIGREASRPYNRNHRSVEFFRVHQNWEGRFAGERFSFYSLANSYKINFWQIGKALFCPAPLGVDPANDTSGFDFPNPGRS
jgi:hypothetical protein